MALSGTGKIQLVKPEIEISLIETIKRKLQSPIWVESVKMVILIYSLEVR